MDSSVHPEECCTAASIPSKGQACKEHCWDPSPALSRAGAMGDAGKGRDWSSQSHLGKEHLALHHGQVRDEQQGTATATEKIHCSCLTDNCEVSLHHKELKFSVTDSGFPPSEQD